MRLSDRLERIAAKAAEVTEGYVADVGTDHGFVPIRLMETGSVKHVVAMDVRKGPLSRAAEHVREYQMEDQIETRLSDGLKELKPGEADTVIIAGMGGELMLRILRDGVHMQDSVKHYVLSPQSELSVFRHGLEQLGLAIVEEQMLMDEGKYYVILHAAPGTMHYEQEYEYRYGADLIRKQDPVLKEFLERELAQGEELLAHLSRTETEGAKKRAESLRQELEETKEAYHALQELIEKLEELAPRSLACDWDNPGFLAGRGDKEIKKVLVALDATDRVVEQAVREGADLLLTHHPLIFRALKQVNDANFISRRIVTLLQADISYFAMHTNFDAAPGCMADLAAARMGIQNGQPLEVTGEVKGEPVGIGKSGVLAEPVSLDTLAEQVKQAFGLPFVLVYGSETAGEKVSRVAVSPGAGGSMIRYALEQKAEVLVTGDIGHHDAIDAAAQGMAIIDAGHYGLEHIFMPFMAEYVTRVSGGAIEVIQAEPDFPARVL